MITTTGIRTRGLRASASLHVEAAHAGHVQIENQAIWHVSIDRKEELGARGEAFHRESRGRDESYQRDAHVRIVVHDREERRVTGHCR